MNGVDNTASEAFTRASRLTHEAEFRRVFARPRVSQDRYFRVLGRQNDLAWSRVGLAVSVKVCKRATGRNRIKRLVRESFRKHHATPGRTPAGTSAYMAGIDMVVLPRPDAATMCNKTLYDALVGHWKQQQKLAGDSQAQAKTREKN